MSNAIALGTFDGVHLGHRAVLDMPDGFHKTAVIFGEAPKLIISGINDSLMTPEKKVRILHGIGIDDVYMLDFEKVRNETPQEFLAFLKNKFSPSLISCGFNYRFGHKGAGDVNTLQRFCDENGIELRCCEPVVSGGVPVSSSLIRDMLKKGDVALANRLMSCGFSYTSEVIHGDRRGRTIGFPTVNQRYPDGLVKLKFGVYSVIVRFEGAEHFGITNIGIRPTYPSDFVISETYIDSFCGDLYGKEIEICPLRFLRGETEFSSIEELKNQISKDILIAKKGL